MRSIPPKVIGGIKAKGYDVIGVRVFLCKLMRFLRKKYQTGAPYTTSTTNASWERGS